MHAVKSANCMRAVQGRSRLHEKVAGLPVREIVTRSRSVGIPVPSEPDFVEEHRGSLLSGGRRGIDSTRLWDCDFVKSRASSMPWCHEKSET